MNHTPESASPKLITAHELAIQLLALPNTPVMGSRVGQLSAEGQDKALTEVSVGDPDFPAESPSAIYLIFGGLSPAAAPKTHQPTVLPLDTDC